MSVAASAQALSSGTPPLLKGGEFKAPSAFRTISEVASDLNVPQHVLRFWESKFQQIRPLKRGGGRRYYRPDDIELISSIKDLLYNQGLTIRGVQKLLKETGRSGIVRPSSVAATSSAAVPVLAATGAVLRPASGVSNPLSSAARREMETVLDELRAMRDLLRQSGI